MNTKEDQLQFNLNLLAELCERQSPSGSLESVEFIYFLAHYLREKGYEVTTDKWFNIYAIKNTTNPKYYPCFVAHTDTAQELHEGLKLVNTRGVLTAVDNNNKQVGAGFDDKVGICIALQLADVLPDVKLFFPSDEEVGCAGTREADLSFFNDISFCAQADRRGDKDFIYYTNGTQVISEAFLEFIADDLKNFEYELEHGSFTDVGELVNRGVGICCFNISAGYQFEHTKNEELNIAAAQKCLNFLYQVTPKLIYQRWIWVPESIPTSFDPFSNYSIEFEDKVAELLYELKGVKHLPRRVKILIDEINKMLYAPYYKKEHLEEISISSNSQSTSTNWYQYRWDDLDM